MYSKQFNNTVNNINISSAAVHVELNPYKHLWMVGVVKTLSQIV